MSRFHVFVPIILLAMTAGAQTTKLTGKAVDPSGALVTGAEVTVIGPGNATVATTTTGPDGSFTVDVAPGSYALDVSADGFEKAVQGISVGANNRPLTVTLSVARVTQQVDVEESPDEVSLDPESNQTALVLKEDDIQSLPEDTDDLVAYLTEIAGPRAAAAGGVQFIIDGFLGGQLPPKDQIREIRINTNPFTTEYSRSGFGRIEVITRPGTGKLRGNFNFNFRNDALNATQFNAPEKLPYSRQNFQANLSGPFIHDRLTMTLAAQRNDSFTTNTIRALVPDSSGSVTNFGASIKQPNLRENFNSRGQYAINSNHTLNFNLELLSNTRSNQGVSQTTLPERASSSTQKQFAVQMRETAILSPRLVHDTRLEFTDSHATTNPLTEGVAINVLDTFQSGGSQNVSDSTNRSVLFGDTLIFNSKGFTLKAGTQGDYYRNRIYNANNFLGTFTFSTLDSYVAGQPATFSMNRGNPLFYVNQFEFGAFLQTDITLSKRWLISPGVRYQIQTNLHDYNNFDPRVSVAYQLNRTTVLRLGAGTFHQTFATNLVQQLEQLNGTNQSQIVIRNPSFPDPFAGGIEQTVPASLRTPSDSLVATYTNNISGSLEKSLKSGATISVAYDFIRGNHVLRSRNLNAPLPGTPLRPDPAQGNVLQLESSGDSSFNGLTLGYRARIHGSLNMFSNYTFSSSYNDTDGAFSLPANNYDLRSEWGRSSDNQRHHFQVGLNGRIPGNLNLNTTVRWNTGRPYNIMTGFDDNSDTDINDRPFGIARNSSQGPGLFDTSINLSKTISLVKGERGSTEGLPAGGNRGGGGGFGGNRGGGGARGGGGFGGGGNRGGGNRGNGSAATTSATFFVNIQNALNHRNFNNPIGTLSSPLFGQSISAQAPRTVELGVRINF